MAALKPYAGIRGLKISRILGLEAWDKRSNHIDVVKGQYDNLAAYRKGKGGRASFSGLVVTVFGCSGYLGHYVTQRLGKVGSQVICPYRGDPYELKEMKLAGDLGQILFLKCDLQNEEEIKKAIKYSNVVINLVGRDWETKNFTFQDCHVDIARRLARLARENGVERFIHVSHLLANPSPQQFFMRKPSRFLSAKFEGELVVKEEFPEATILRPSDVFGNHDKFLRYYSSSWRRSATGLPLWKKGEKTYKSPVYLSDVVEGIVAAAMDPSTAGKEYDFMGPHTYHLSELIDYFYRCMRYEDFKRVSVSPLFLAKVKFMTYAPHYPILNFDKLEREHMNDVHRSLLNLADLGVTLTPIESVAEYELKMYQKSADYGESVGEFPVPAPPERLYL